MESVNIKAAELTPAQKMVIEELLGHPLEGSETVALRLLPDTQAMREARSGLADWLQQRERVSGNQRASEITEDVLAEAMRTVRPGYRPLS